MTRRKIATVLVALLLVGGVAYYWHPWQPTQNGQQKGFPGFFKKGAARNPTEAVPVLASEARLADVPIYLNGVGTAKALNTVTVRPQIDGKLINVSYTEGQDVPQGYVLAKIDPATYQAQYDQSVAKKAQDEAQLANAKVDLARYTRLVATNAVNAQQLDTQKAMVAQLEALVKFDQAVIDNSRVILSYTDIVAPIAGRTGIRLVDEGNIVHASDTTGIVVITQLRPISVFFSLPQQELPQLTKGMAEGQLPLDALAPDSNDVIDRGKVVVIDNQVDPTTGTVKLKAEFPNPDLQLWPGQFINVRVLINTLRQVVVVPTAAVQRGPDGTFVYVVQDDKAAMRPVMVGQQDDVEAVIDSGVKASERVVTTGFARLADGTLVTASSAEEAGQVTPGERPARNNPRNKGKGKGNAKRSPTSGGTTSSTP